MNTIYDFLGIKLLPETAKRDSDNENVYQIEAVDLHLVPRVCPICRHPIVSKGNYHKVIYDYCSIPFGDKEKHIYKIKLKNRRYECKNTSSTHSFTVGITDMKSPYTNAFRFHVVSSYLKNRELFYTDIAKRCAISIPTVSMIVNEFAEQIYTCYLPAPDHKYLQLTGFHYQGNNRYYLAQIQHDSKPSLLAFFGYQDAEEEMKEYFVHYNNNCKYAAETTVYIATNTDKKYHEKLCSYLPNSVVSYDNKTLYSHIDSYIGSYHDGCYDEVVKKIFDIKQIFMNHRDDSCISDWREDMSPDVAMHLNELKMELKYNLSLLRLSAEKFTADLEKINDDISYYNERKLSFNVMVLRMMYQNHGDSIFDHENMNLYFVPKPALWDEDGNLNILEITKDEPLDIFYNELIDDENINFDDASPT